MTPVHGTSEVDTAAVASLIANSTRAGMLDLLFDRGEHSIGALAKKVSVSPSAASGHLRRLVVGGLVLVERHGRERRVRLAGPDVAHALEALSSIAPPREPTTLRTSERTRMLRAARTCYDHLAGALAVALTDGLCERGLLCRPDLSLTSAGATALGGFGIDIGRLERGSRPLTRACMDWSERRHHLAGALGAALCSELLSRRWIDRLPEPRAVRLTPAGRQGLYETLGLSAAWAG
jgi:DNA-binding transcriptional ArsR family regulator